MDDLTWYSVSTSVGVQFKDCFVGVLSDIFYCMFQSPEERSMFGEMLNLLVLLKPDSCDLIMKLLTILAHKKLGLRLVYR